MQSKANSFAELEPKIRASTSQQWHKLDLSLGRIQRLLALLGNPERALRGIHIAGTNGKGSTGAMLFSVLANAGKKVGLYTSPHLVSYAERFRIGAAGQTTLIAEERFYDYLKQLYLLVENTFQFGEQQPTWFEIQTALALCYFRDEKVDWAIIEVGLGGRFDATNVKDWEYKIITDIDLDHTAVLGDTVAEIAFEKAGILAHTHFAGYSPQLVTSANGDALAVIKAIANSKGVPSVVAGEDITLCDAGMDITGTSVTVHQSCAALDGAYRTPLIGWHQVRNLACVLGVLGQMVATKDLDSSCDQVQSGLDQTRWPGRLQVIDLPSWPPEFGTLILDGAHNPAGMKTLVQTLRSLLPKQVAQKVRVIFAAKADKNVSEMLTLLQAVADEYILTNIHPSVPVADLSGLSISPIVFSAETPKSALEFTLAHANSKDYTIVCGSLYLLGEVLKVLAPQPLWKIDEMTYSADARRSYKR